MHHLTVLLNSVRAIARGESLLEPATAEPPIDQRPRADSEGEPTTLDALAPPAQTTAQEKYDAITKVLTPREFDVFKHIAAGLSNAEIASVLNVSTDTIKTHVSRLLIKLYLRDRVRAVILAYESGTVLVIQTKPPTT